MQACATGYSQGYTIAGVDTAKVSLVISDGVNTFPLTPVGGQAMQTNLTYRSNDSYLIPPGYSVQAKSTIPASFDMMPSIVEEV